MATYSAHVSNPLYEGDTLYFLRHHVAIDNLPTWWIEDMRMSSPVVDDHFISFEFGNFSGIEKGDILGLFYEDGSGILQPGATGIWTGSYMHGIFTLEGDPDGIAPKTGFEQGEKIHYKLWDPEHSVEYDIQPVYATRDEV